jgi:hypothetical protein
MSDYANYLPPWVPSTKTTFQHDHPLDYIYALFSKDVYMDDFVLLPDGWTKVVPESRCHRDGSFDITGNMQ